MSLVQLVQGLQGQATFPQSVQLDPPRDRPGIALGMIFLALFLLLCRSALAQDLAITPELLSNITRSPSLSWSPGVNAIFVGKTLSEAQKMLGALPPTSTHPSLSHVAHASPSFIPPFNFDTYSAWPQCQRPIRNQGQCGSCWAFSAAESLSDRFCVAGTNVTLSPQWIVSCDHNDLGCGGGVLSTEWEFILNTGIVTDSCCPYQSSHGYIPVCPFACHNVMEPLKKYKILTYSHYSSVEAATQDLVKYGSFQAAFTVYQDFFAYKSGVYRHTTGKNVGGHAIKIQGWGRDSKSGLEYWNVANSWGYDWGIDGYVWFMKGVNECGIEDQMYGGLPWTD